MADRYEDRERGRDPERERSGRGIDRDYEYDRARYDFDRYGGRHPNDFDRSGRGMESERDRFGRSDPRSHREPSGGMNRGYGSDSGFQDEFGRDRGYGRGQGYEGGYGERGRGYEGGYGRRQGYEGGYGERGRGYEGGYPERDRFGRSMDRDYGSMRPPMSWSYTELWYIPGPETGRGPEGYQRSRERIREDVNERLTQHGQLDARQIQIEVEDNGEVTLNGTVRNRREKRMAEDVVESVMGVRDVHNRLRIQEESGERMPDQQQQQQQDRTQKQQKSQEKEAQT